MTLLDFYITVFVSIVPIITIGILLYVDGRDRDGNR